MGEGLHVYRKNSTYPGYVLFLRLSSWWRHLPADEAVVMISCQRWTTMLLVILRSQRFCLILPMEEVQRKGGSVMQRSTAFRMYLIVESRYQRDKSERNAGDYL